MAGLNQEAFAAAVRELSHTYEEISLLYRTAETFASLSVDDICGRILDEAVGAIGVKTAAVLFLDEPDGILRTKVCRGVWSPDRCFGREAGVIWHAIEARKPSAFCRLAETEHAGLFPGQKSLLICPILGKARVVGAIVVADKQDDAEFFANDTKLLMAISTQAGLAIENAHLYQELELLLVGAIRSLVKALEATSFWTAGHTERVTSYAIEIGKVMGLDSASLEKLKICALLHDIGKIATPKDILNKDAPLTDAEWLEIRKHPGVGAEILEEVKQFKDVVHGIKYHHEHWDGRGGIFGLHQEEIPLLARILSVADTFDALTSDRPYRSKRTKEEALKEIQRCSGTQFDPAVVRSFCDWAGRS
ncbi:MAG: hypothetical protein OHK006_04960 [Thermodesulfovibrionales bacterium]